MGQGTFVTLFKEAKEGTKILLKQTINKPFLYYSNILIF